MCNTGEPSEQKFLMAEQQNEFHELESALRDSAQSMNVVADLVPQDDLTKIEIIKQRVLEKFEHHQAQQVRRRTAARYVGVLASVAALVGIAVGLRTIGLSLGGSRVSPVARIPSATVSPPSDSVNSNKTLQKKVKNKQVVLHGGHGGVASKETTSQVGPFVEPHGSSGQHNSTQGSDSLAVSASGNFTFPPNTTLDQILQSTVAVGPFRVFKSSESNAAESEPIPVLLEVKQDDGQVVFAPCWIVPERTELVNLSQFSPSERQSVRRVLQLDESQAASDEPVI